MPRRFEAKIAGAPTPMVAEVWAGAVKIDRVEVSCDHGKSWSNATLEERNAPKNKQFG